MFSVAINLYQCKHFPNDLILLRTDRVCGTLMHELWLSIMKIHRAACCSLNVLC